MKHLLSGFFLAGITYAAFQPGLWAFRCPVTISQGAFDVLPLDVNVYRASKAQLRDLRLLRSGVEIPYVLRTLSGGREETRFNPSITDQIAIPGLGSQVTLKIEEHTPHNRLRIETSQKNFRQQVRIEGSDDGKHWGLIRRDGTIFDVSTPDQHASNLAVPYPESTRLYLRVTVMGWRSPNAIRSVSMSFVQDTPPRREIVAQGGPNVTPDVPGRTSVIDVDLGFDRPFDCMSFETRDPLFSRSVVVSVSHNKKDWNIAGIGIIERTTNKESLSVSVPEHWARYVRATVRNEDNSPLTLSDVRVEALRRELIFPANVAGSYWLYSGKANAQPVQYDLGAVLPVQANLLPATAGPVESNPNYQGSEPPVTERSPWLLPVLLALLVPVLGGIAFRMLRKVSPSE